MNQRRWSTLHLRGDYCRSTWQPKPMSEVKDYAKAWGYWTALKQRTKERGSKCLPKTAAGIIRYVFPAATEDAAIRVAYCESRLYTYAQNPSGASGLFQLMPIHWLGRFNPFNPWANTRYAYQLSHAGYDWGAWVCKP